MTELAKRRRALIAGAGKGVPISTLQPGSVVQVKENGTLVPFIYLGLNAEQKALILRKNCYTSKTRFGSTPVYNGSEIDNRLVNTYRPQYTNLLAYLSPSTINYVVYDKSYAYSLTTITRDIFAPSYYELTGTGPETGYNILPVLKTYKATANDNTARLSDVAYWTRSMFSNSSYPDRVNIVDQYGRCLRNSYFKPPSDANTGTRPILSLQPSTPVNQDMIVGEM